MSLVLDRGAQVAVPPEAMSARAAFALSPAGRVLLAVLASGAGVLHLAMVPSYWGSSVVEGVGFALTGWAQIAIAVLLLTSPSRVLLRVTMLVNVVAIGVWMISRTTGLPFGDQHGQPRAGQFIGLVCVGIEIASVLLAAWWLEHPTFGRTWRGARLAAFAVVPFAVLALATAALASPSARNHAHDSHAQSISTALASGGSSGHVHAPPVASAGASDIVDVNGHHVHGVKAQAVGAELQADVPLDAATRATLAQQLVVARDTAMRYPTVADAE